MLKLLKNLKKSIISVIFIVILLCIQAATDLALPDYTSKIVNVGIQAGGIENAVPDIILKDDMDMILLFTQNDNEILDNYKLVGYIETKREEEIIEKYFDKDQLLEPDTVYILNEIEDERRNNLSKILTTPLMQFSSINNEETANQIKEQLINQVPEEQKQHIQAQTIKDLIKNMPEEQRTQMLQEFNKQIENMAE